MANESGQAKEFQEQPLPLLEGLTAGFYAHCKKGELRFQCCSSCGRWRHVPRVMCSACGSWEWTWEQSSGKGKVFTWTVVARSMHPYFLNVPYAPAVIELEEGVRLVSWVEGCAPEDLAMGMPVEVSFEDISEDVSLPKFKRV